MAVHALLDQIAAEHTAGRCVSFRFFVKKLQKVHFYIKLMPHTLLLSLWVGTLSFLGDAPCMLGAGNTFPPILTFAPSPPPFSVLPSHLFYAIAIGQAMGTVSNNPPNHLARSTASAALRYTPVPELHTSVLPTRAL